MVDFDESLMPDSAKGKNGVGGISRAANRIASGSSRGFDRTISYRDRNKTEAHPDFLSMLHTDCRES